MYLFIFSNGEISKEKQALSTFLDFFNLLWTLWSFLGGDIYPIISRGILLEKHKFQQESLSLWLQRHSSRIDRCRNRFHRTRSKWIFFFSKFYGKVGKTRPATTIGNTCWRNFNIFRRLYRLYSKYISKPTLVDFTSDTKNCVLYWDFDSNSWIVFHSWEMIKKQLFSFKIAVLKIIIF